MRALLTWILFSILLFLCPGPVYWYSLLHGFDASDGGFWHSCILKIQLFLIHVEEHKESKQVFVHFILMTLCAFYFLKELSNLELIKRSNNPRLSTLITLIFVFFFSLLVEIIQTKLPISFNRGFDWIDIGVSLLGGLLGIVGALAVLKNK